jgi:transcriptional regulator with XRE-family HTH domain
MQTEIYIGKKLRRIRVEKGLTREHLAFYSGLTAQLIFRAEKEGNIMLSSYVKIMDVLDNYRKGQDFIPPYISKYELLFGGDNVSKPKSKNK